MLDPENDPTTADQSEPVSDQPGAPQADIPPESDAAPAKKAARAPRKSAKKAPAKRAAAKTAASEPPEGPAADSTDASSATPAGEVDVAPVKKTTRAPRKRAAATRATGEATPAPPAEPVVTAPETTTEPSTAGGGTTPLFQAPAITTTVRRRGTRKATSPAPEQAPEAAVDAPDASAEQPPPPPRKRSRKAVTANDEAAPTDASDTSTDAAGTTSADEAPAKKKSGKKKKADASETSQGAEAPAKKKSGKKKKAEPAEPAEPDETAEATEDDGATPTDDDAVAVTEAAADDAEQATTSSDEESDDESGARRRPRRRGGRRRRRGGGGDGADADGRSSEAEGDDATGAKDAAGSDETDGSGEKQGSGEPSGAGESDDEGGSSSRRRRRRRGGGRGGGNGGDGERRTRNPEDEITSISGSTRMEAKKQRRREGREAGRRRAPIVSEAEFLARRESVDRVMVVRQRDDLTQIGVLEDKVLVEHYVSRESQTSMIGNVYLGRVQNVLPSMEAAFVDIGKGRNAVLYAGEVNWKALGAKDGQARKIESVLSPGQTILVQVSKDPIGHKGARLTSQVSLPGRFLVYVPDGTTSGISRKLPEGERGRLKTLLKEIVPDSAGVIVRTAAEGASEEELTKDVERLTARWSDIEAKVEAGGGKGGAPQLLYGEPDLTLKVVRDLFTEDFARLVVQGDDAWDLVDGYVSHVAPDLRERLEHYRPEDEANDGVDLFSAHRVDEQIAKGMDRKVWLPSGGSLVIDRTEAMTVVDVNTGKFTGSGGNLEETVTKNNLEAAEEVVRQLRLRDIGGIVVVDFIDMVLESNRDLVLRRLVECLGRDRTRHQVAEVTSLGLVQMTRKRIGTGLLEAFGEECTACKGRGITVHEHPVEPQRHEDDSRRGRGGRGRGGNGGGGGGGRGNGGNGGNGGGGNHNGTAHAPSPMDVAAKARPENADKPPVDEPVEDVATAPEAPVVASNAADSSLPEAAPAQTDATGSPDATDGTDRDGAQTSSLPEPAEHAEPAEQAERAPSVVTASRRRTSRRAAGRPAGPPPALPADAPTAPDGSAGEPAVGDADQVSLDPGPADAPVVEDETLPLDPAVPEADDTDQPDAADGTHDDVLPVPIKRRGGRRR